MSLTSDPNDPRIKRGGPDTAPVPQNEVYLVLSEEARKKGWVRPYRDQYKHVGIRPKHPTRPLNEKEQRTWGEDKNGFVLFEQYPEGQNPTGRYWTQAELDSGCGAVTTMGRALSETYAANPGFYGSTYCVGCCMHKRVSEFIWTTDGQRVGS